MVIDTGGVGKNRLHAPTTDTAKTRGPAADSASSSSNSAQASSGDNVSLSGAGHAMNRLEGKVQSSADVDTAKVDAIKRSIANGSFNPDPSAIADKMLSDF